MAEQTGWWVLDQAILHGPYDDIEEAAWAHRSIFPTTLYRGTLFPIVEDLGLGYTILQALSAAGYPIPDERQRPFQREIMESIATVYERHGIPAGRLDVLEQREGTLEILVPTLSAGLRAAEAGRYEHRDEALIDIARCLGLPLDRVQALFPDGEPVDLYRRAFILARTFA